MFNNVKEDSNGRGTHRAGRWVLREYFRPYIRATWMTGLIF